MDDEGFLECTQALPDDWDADSDGEPHEQPELVAWLLVGDTKYEVYEGETKIGRDSASCAIVLSQKVLSKEHAALEVTSGVHTLVDLGSMNKTRIGKMCILKYLADKRSRITKINCSFDPMVNSNCLPIASHIHVRTTIKKFLSSASAYRIKLP
ncbi:uncharacterized protein LOC135222356 [Macrobrachium nipponense]|uniref:uncharacterized protein LOC135222356 n=1 Tax=Macrobrachium nipponense TaxID=159736 RepID=UPI0030C8CEE5